MKISKLPPDVIDRLVALDQHADALAQAATLVEAELAGSRDLINGVTRVADHSVLLQAQSTFDETLKAAQEARKRADAGSLLRSICKAYIDQLPADAGLEVVTPPQPNGADLSEVRNQISGLRAQLAAIRNAPVPAPNIRERVEAYIDRLAHHGRPLLRGFHAGGELHVSWPMSIDVNRQNGSGFDDRQGNALLLMAIFQRDALIDYVLAEIKAETDALMPVSERGPRLGQLETDLAALQSIEVMLVSSRIESGETNITQDPTAPPQVILGVSVRA